jgi:hypothetical protein
MVTSQLRTTRDCHCSAQLRPPLACGRPSAARPPRARAQKEKEEGQGEGERRKRKVARLGREGEGDQGCGRPAPHVGTLGVDDAQGPSDLVESLGHGEADAKAGLKVPGASAVSNLPLLEQDS